MQLINGECIAEMDKLIAEGITVDCVECHSVIREKEIQREREIEYYKPNICVRCHVKITGGYYSDRSQDGSRAGGNICSPCVAIEDSEIIEVVANIVREVN